MRRSLVLPLVLGWMFGASAVDAGVSSSWKSVPIPPLAPLKAPKPQVKILKNGLTLYLLEDHELPLVEMVAMVRTGERWVPAGKTGLGSIFGEVWRTGGAAGKTGDELDELLEARAAHVEADMNDEMATVSANCLVDDVEAVAKVFADVVRRPTFAADKIEIAKARLRSEIARRNDESEQIAHRETVRLGYGASHPYARVPEYATVEAVTADDLRNWHRTWVSPGRTRIGVVGDFDAKTMAARLEKLFGDWPKGTTTNDPQLPAPKPAAAGVYFVERPDVTQAAIQLVHLGGVKNHPDEAAIAVMNEVLGAPFWGRLFSNVRTTKGLGYHVGGQYELGADHPGLFTVTLETKNQTAAAGIDALVEEVRGMTARPPTAEDIDRAKDAILNSWVFRFDSPGKILFQRMTLDYQGRPADFLERFPERVRQVTAADVLRVARERLRPDQLAIFVLGKSADFDRPLSSFGHVTPIDIAIPAPKTQAVAASDDMLARGRAAIARALERAGGADKLAAVKAVRMKGQLELIKPMAIQLAMNSLYDLAGERLRQDLETPMGAMTVVLTPTVGYQAMGAQKMPIPEAQRTESLKDLRRTVFGLARAFAHPATRFASVAAETVDGVAVDVVEVTSGDAIFRLAIAADGRIVEERYDTIGEQGPTSLVQKNEDFRTAGGFTLPHRTVTLEKGEKASVVSIESVEIDPAVDAQQFAE